MNVDLITRLIKAGTPPELVAEVATELARIEVANDQPSKGALRTRRWRERHQASQNVTSDAEVTEVTESVTPPSLDKKGPQTPKKINPIPGVVTALARKAGGFGPPDGVPLDRWNALCQQRKKPVTEIAYDRMCKTLREGADAGWPPGELVERSIERGYETVFVPKEQRHERPNAIRRAGTDTSGADIFAELQARRQAQPH